MDSDSKGFAIFVTAVFLGFLGSVVVGWPAAVAAGIAIAFIAGSKTEDGDQ